MPGRLRFVPMVVILALSASRMLVAQAVDRASALRMFSSVTDRLHGNASLPDNLRNMTAKDLIGHENSNYIGLLDDDNAHRFMRALADLMPQLPLEMCGTILSPSNGKPIELETMLAYADSSSIAAWSVVLEQVVLARAAGARNRKATPQEVQGTMRTLIGHMTDENRIRLLTIASNPPPTPEDGCWSVRQVLTGLAELTPADLGPVVRRMFGTVSSE